jgi:hypothetical protein
MPYGQAAAIPGALKRLPQRLSGVMAGIRVLQMPVVERLGAVG